MNLILFEREEVSAAGVVSLADGRAAHLIQVLKVTPGHTVRVGVLDGPIGVGTVTSIATTTVELQCELEPTIHHRLGATARPNRLIGDSAPTMIGSQP